MTKLYMKSTIVVYIRVEEEKIQNISQPVISISDFIGIGMAQKVKEMNELLNDKGWDFKPGDIETGNITARQGEKRFEEEK